MTNTIITKDNGRRELPFDHERLVSYINNQGIHDNDFIEKMVRVITSKKKFPASDIPELAIQTALERVDIDAPEWTYKAASILLTTLYKQAGVNRRSPKSVRYGDFYELVVMLTEKGVYGKELLEKYTEEELRKAGDMIVPQRDDKFTYQGLRMLATRYLATGEDKNVYELPQERWLVIALYLMQNEPKDVRLKYVEEFYWTLSNLYVTVATPTLANAGKKNGQLSSCFIDTIGDSLRDIYDSNTDVATLSKEGGGIGVYVGKIRARGSDIRGVKGVASGTLPWIKQLNNTAVSVDQLGTRSGAIAVYQDVWHKDIRQHLDLKLNNGDERLRAYDIFTGVNIPDLFMEQVAKRGSWYLFDPHEVKKVKGYSLEDFYDESKDPDSLENKEFSKRYFECVQDERISKEKVNAMDIMKRIIRSTLQTGSPFFFFRDTVNRANPNKHEGMIYCSNLCSEIAQNQSPSEFVSQEIVTENDEQLIVYKRRPGDFVVCNLASTNLGTTVTDGVLERVIKILVRALDNVIDVNRLPVPQTKVTNGKYRAIGLGTFGWHHLLALKGIGWETEEAVKLTDELYEKIAYNTIKASMEIAKEKGAYPLFKGSDWDNGDYFTNRGYFDTVEGTETDREGSMASAWKELYAEIKEHGIRNGYLMAVAPNASTSVIAGSTATIDPIFKPHFFEEKKDAKYPVVAPDMSPKTYDVYRRSAYVVDQRWSVEQNIARQRHVDQAISFNIYVPNTIHAKYLLDIYFRAWEGGVKTIYYTRSTAVEVDECEWCQS